MPKTHHMFEPDQVLPSGHVVLRVWLEETGKPRDNRPSNRKERRIRLRCTCGNEVNTTVSNIVRAPLEGCRKCRDYRGGRPAGPPRTCDVEGCDSIHQARGLCRLHSYRFERYGTVELPKRIKGACTVEGCESPNYATGMCRLHYDRMRRTGHTYTTRKFRSRNET